MRDGSATSAGRSRRPSTSTSRSSDPRHRTSIGPGSATCCATTRHGTIGSSRTGSAGARRAGHTTPAWSPMPRPSWTAVVDALDEIRTGTEAGIRALVNAHRWGGTTFHDSGWNPRHIEGVEHFVFYNLERITGRHFIHGQPVGLGIIAGSVLQDNEPEAMAAALARGRRRHPARSDGRHLGRRRARRCGRSLVCPRGRPVVHGGRRRARDGRAHRADPGDRRARPSRGPGPRHEDRADVAPGLRPGVPGARCRNGLAANGRGRPMGRGPRFRFALGLRPHAGRSAAGGGADLRAVRRARGTGGRDTTCAPRAPRPRRVLPERRA